MDNVIVWFDVPTLDFDRAIKFYSAVLDKEIKPETFQGEKLAFFPMQPKSMGVGGDIMPPSPDFKPSTEGTKVHFSVEGRIDDALAKAEAMGGQIVRPKFMMPDVGYLAMIKDTEGNIVGLHSRT